MSIERQVSDMQVGETGFVTPWSFEIGRTGETVIATWRVAESQEMGTHCILIKRHVDYVTVLNPEKFPEYEGEYFQMGKKVAGGRISVRSIYHSLIPKYRTEILPVHGLPFKFLSDKKRNVKTTTLLDGSTMHIIDAKDED